MRTHTVNTGGDPELVTQTPVGIQNGQVAPTTQKVHIMSDMPATLNLEVCNQTSSLNPQTFFLVQVPQQNTPKLILLPSHQILNPQQKVPVAPSANANLVPIPNTTGQRNQQSKASRKRTRQKTSNAVSNITTPNKNILIMPNTSQALPSVQPLQFQTIQSFPRAQTLPMGQNFIVLQNMAEQSPLQLPTVQINTMPPSQKATNLQIQQVSNAQDITIQSLPGSQDISNIQVKTVPPSEEMSNIQTLSSPPNISNVHLHQELPNLQLQTGPTTTHLSDLHLQALQETQSLQESRNLIVVQNSPGEEIVSTSESVESLQSMEEVQDVHFETLQTEDGLQNVLVLQNADGEQTRLCVQGVENIQGIQDVSNVQIQAMSNMQEPGNSAPECQKVFIIQSAQGEQTLQVVDNFQADQNVHVVENIQGLQSGQNQLQVGQNQLQVLPGLQGHTVQLPQNVQLRTVPSGQGLQAVQNVQGLQNIQTVNSGAQNIQTIQLVQKNSVQGLQHVLPFIQIVQSAPKVQLVHTF